MLQQKNYFYENRRIISPWPKCWRKLSRLGSALFSSVLTAKRYVLILQTLFTYWVLRPSTCFIYFILTASSISINTSLSQRGTRWSDDHFFIFEMYRNAAGQIVLPLMWKSSVKSIVNYLDSSLPLEFIFMLFFSRWSWTGCSSLWELVSHTWR